ncbi:MAG: T9SS type A sorting domain-containing protein [Bacteroidetes bacterium]|nr:T9SS type A sorting domain-containing protein [Bacteroidota bacterium]
MVKPFLVQKILQNHISISDLASGIYLIQVQKEREVFQARFVKE